MPCLYVIDENNRIIDSDNTENIHKKGLLHRSVHVIVVNSLNMYFCRKIKQKNLLYPNYWSTSTGAHIEEGQTSKEAANDSLRNLLSINADLRYIGDIHVKDNVENEISATYIVHYDYPIEINWNELNGGAFFTLDEINKLYKTGRITPHVKASIDLYKKIKSSE